MDLKFQWCRLREHRGISPFFSFPGGKYNREPPDKLSKNEGVVCATFRGYYPGPRNLPLPRVEKARSESPARLIVRRVPAYPF